MEDKLTNAIARLQAIRNSREDAMAELIEWAADHIEALSDRVRLLEPVRTIGGVLEIDTTEEETKGE